MSSFLFPRLGVSACVWRNGKMLIAKRSKPPFKGVWSLPGGHVELGEGLRDAARRELLEETGVEADLVTIIDVVEAIRRDGDEVQAREDKWTIRAKSSRIISSVTRTCTFDSRR